MRNTLVQLAGWRQPHALVWAQAPQAALPFDSIWECKLCHKYPFPGVSIHVLFPSAKERRYLNFFFFIVIN